MLSQSLLTGEILLLASQYACSFIVFKWLFFCCVRCMWFWLGGIFTSNSTFIVPCNIYNCTSFKRNTPFIFFKSLYCLTISMQLIVNGRNNNSACFIIFNWNKIIVAEKSNEIHSFQGHLWIVSISLWGHNAFLEY